MYRKNNNHRVAFGGKRSSSLPPRTSPLSSPSIPKISIDAENNVTITQNINHTINPEKREIVISNNISKIDIGEFSSIYEWKIRNQDGTNINGVKVIVIAPKQADTQYLDANVSVTGASSYGSTTDTDTDTATDAAKQSETSEAVKTVIPIGSVVIAGGSIARPKILTQAVGVVKNLAKDAAADVKNFAKDAAADVKNFAKDAAADVKNVAVNVAADVKNVAVNVAANVKNVAVNVAADVKNAVTNAAAAVGRFFRRRR
jgi:hypothetical protein